MNYCSNCGANLKPNNKYCTECGFAIKKKISLDSLLKILVVFLLIIGTIIALYIFWPRFFPKKPSTISARGNSVGNIINSGLVSHQDPWIYYSNWSDENQLYKIRSDGKQRTKLNNDNSSDINVIGEWIYYRNWSDGFQIYKIRTDGKARTKLNEEIGRAHV